MKFELDATEQQACKEFYREHSACMSKSGAIGECVSPTSLHLLV